MRHLLKLVGRLGRVDEVAHDHFFLRSTVAEMVDIICKLSRQAEDAQFTAAQFRDQVENGRKVAIQILEFFDRHGVTLRRGDLRRINKHRLDLFRDPGEDVPANETADKPPWGREASLVGRPDFKSGRGREPVSWWVRLPLSSANSQRERMSALAEYLTSLQRDAQAADAAESAFRRDAAERIAALALARAKAFRRVNLVRSVADAAEGAESEEMAVAVAQAQLRVQLGWATESEARDEVLSRFAPVAQALFHAAQGPQDEAPADPGGALASF